MSTEVMIIMNAINNNFITDVVVLIVKQENAILPTNNF
jgi:hypothetical protein